MTDASMPDALHPRERASIERMLAAASSGECTVLDAELVWERRHLLRLTTSEGTVIAKRAKVWADGTVDRASVRCDAAALSLCDTMPIAVAPRLVGFDPDADLLVMEDLPAGRALADLLLLDVAVVVEDGLRSVARALASIHAWTEQREDADESIAAVFASDDRVWPPWLGRAHDRRAGYLTAVASLGVATSGLDDEIDRALQLLGTSPYRGLVHGDLCPDNVRVTDGGARIFDFEGATIGPWALDVAYFLAPFPSCWCFADLPSSVAEGAVAAYEHEIGGLGVTVGDDWHEALAAALACFVVVHAARLSKIEESDDEWGTTTMRPRLVSWLSNFASYAASETTFPSLTAAARTAVGILRDRWTDLAPPIYPAFATADVDPVAVPDFWQPGL